MSESIPSWMQAVQVLNPGKQSQLVWQPQPCPQVSPGQLLVKVAAFGINRADLMQRQGLYPPPTGDSSILGLEVAGTVVAVGDASATPWLGQRVFGLVNGGGYAEYALLPQQQALRVPDAMSWAEAAATAETFLTAYQLLFQIGQSQAGDKVLLHAGASGVGTAAILLARFKGVRTAVTVSTDAKAAFCHQLGAEQVINYRQQDFVAALQAKWPEGIQLILDPVAGDYLQREASLLAQDGKIIIYAMMGGRKVPELDLSVLFKKRAQILFSTLRNRSAVYKAQLTQSFAHDFATELAGGNLKPVIQQTFSSAEVNQAHQLLSSNQTIGKLVIVF